MNDQPPLSTAAAVRPAARRHGQGMKAKEPGWGRLVLSFRGETSRWWGRAVPTPVHELVPSTAAFPRPDGTALIPWQPIPPSRRGSDFKRLKTLKR